jgi:hypothetical protein
VLRRHDGALAWVRSAGERGAGAGHAETEPGGEALHDTDGAQVPQQTRLPRTAER